jgi:hypothetical protein
MVGRVFGVVMAYSLLFCPLARSSLRLRNRHKVPGVPGHSAAFAAACYPDDIATNLEHDFRHHAH